MPKSPKARPAARSRARKSGAGAIGARRRASQRTGARPGRSTDPAALAGMTDAAVQAKTGRTWREWTEVLDAAGAARKPHPEIARHVKETFEVSSWWAQTVTVGYERIRGLRVRGQRRDGSYEAHKSRTVPVPLEQLYEAFATPARRRRWLSEPGVAVRRATAGKSMRLAWPDGSSVDVGFAAKAGGKSQVAVQHAQLPSRTAATRMKEYWEERLEALARTLGAGAPGRRR